MRVRTLAVLELATAVLVSASAGRSLADEPDSTDLYGTWRWTETSGGYCAGPCRHTPEACGCERLLVFKPGTYEYIEEDSTHEYMLCQGVVSFQRMASRGGVTADRGHASFLISPADWWVSYERDRLAARFNGPDSLYVSLIGVEDAPSHWFVRTRDFDRRDSSRVRKIRLPLGDRPRRLDVEQLPRETDSVYYEDAPIAISHPEAAYPIFAREARIQGDVLLRVLVDKDGRVKNVKVVRGVKGLDDAAVDAVKNWVFKPALSNNKPVAVWIEIPIQFRL